MSKTGIGNQILISNVAQGPRGPERGFWPFKDNLLNPKPVLHLAPSTLHLPSPIRYLIPSRLVTKNT